MAPTARPAPNKDVQWDTGPSLENTMLTGVTRLKWAHLLCSPSSPTTMWGYATTAVGCSRWPCAGQFEPAVQTKPGTKVSTVKTSFAQVEKAYLLR